MTDPKLLRKELDSVEKNITRKIGWLGVREVPDAHLQQVLTAEQNLLHYLENSTQIHDVKASRNCYRQIIAAADYSTTPFAFRLDTLNRLAISLSNLSGFLNDTSLLVEAIGVLEKAIQLAPPDWEDTCNYIFNIGRFYKDIYDRTGETDILEKADMHFRKAIAVAAPTHRHFGLFYHSYLSMLDALYSKTGILQYLDDALRLGNESLARYSPGKGSRAMILALLGTLSRKKYLRTKHIADLDASIAYLRQSLLLFEKNLGSESRASRQSDLGNALLDKSAMPGFESLLDEAITLQSKAIKTTAPGHMNLPVRYNNLGNCYISKFEKTFKSVSVLNKAIDCFHKAIEFSIATDPVLATRHYNLANALRNRCYMTGSEADLKKANQQYETACTMGLKSYPEWALSASLAWGNMLMFFESYKAAAAAFQYGQQAINNLFRDQVNDLDKNTWLKQAFQLSNKLAYALLRSGQKMEGLVALEQGLARNLREKLALNNLGFKKLKEENNEAWLDYHNAYIDYTQSKQDKIAGAAFGRIKERLDRSIDHIRTMQGFEHFLLVPGRGMVTEALIGLPGYSIIYLLQTESDCLLVVVSSKDKEVHIDEYALEITAVEIKELIAGNFINAIRSGDRTQLMLSLDKLWPFIQEKIIARVEMADCKENVLLVLTGVFDLLPLTVFFPATKNVSVAPSLLSFTQKIPIATGRERILAMGDTDPDNELIFAEAEIDAIRPLFKKEKMTALIGERATRHNMLAGVGTAAYLHFACHGYFDWQSPAESGIKLYEDVLTLRELLNNEVSMEGIRLVNLSACESGINEFTDLPEEAISLPAGFLQAGVPGIVSSLWSVSDVSTSLLMKKFYQLHITEGVNPVNALRQAQDWLSTASCAELELAAVYRELWKQHNSRELAQWSVYYENHPDIIPFAHPYYWAGFYFTGR